MSEKARGIYRARLYTMTAMARGRLRVAPNFGLADPGSRIKWGTPRLVLGLTDPGGIRSVSALVIGGARARLRLRFGRRLAAARRPARPASGAGRIARADRPVHLLDRDRGLPSLRPRPARQPTPASPCAPPGPTPPSPAASCRCSTTSPPTASARAGPSRATPPPASPTPQALAVSFVEPASLYQKLARASKYGFLFIGLTFAAFLLFELLRRLAIHPIQYAFVGLALAIFFLLLTALSEYIPFAAAYAIAAAGCVGLITAYLAHILRSPRAALAFGAALGALYAMLYALLQAEDFSLLGGALLLFALLAGAMIATRRIDWLA